MFSGVLMQCCYGAVFSVDAQQCSVLILGKVQSAKVEKVLSVKTAKAHTCLNLHLLHRHRHRHDYHRDYNDLDDNFT